jgi:tetratricopeptide (TPR) repeat protein
MANSLLFAVPAPEFMPRAKAAALRALELDDSLSEAHSALGMVKLMYDWDFPGAEKAFQRARELDPSNAEAHLRYSQYLAAMGRLDEAIAEGEQAQRLDPLSPLIGQAIGRYHHFLGDEDRAIEHYQKTLQLDPDFYWSHLFISFSYERKGQYDLWWKHFRESLRLGNSGPQVIARMQKAYAAGGYPAAKRELIAIQEEIASGGMLASASLVIEHAKHGNKEKSLYWLQKAYESHTRDLIYLNVEPGYNPIRSDPRFQDIVRRIGLPIPQDKSRK